MKSRTSLKEALQAMAKESEGRPSPTIDQLIAYHQGRLSEPEREQVQDYLCYSPEAIQFLLHLGHSRDMEELTDEMVAADKEAFFQRLEQQDQEERVAEEGALGDSSPATRHPTADSRHDSQPEALLDPHQDSSSWPSRLQTAYATAAAFFFLSVALFLWPASNTADAAIHEVEVPAASVRGDRLIGPETMSTRQILKVNLPVDPGEIGQIYELQIVLSGQNDEPLATDLAKAVEDNTGESVVSFFLPIDLAAGSYRVVINQDPGEDFLQVGSFELEIVP